MQPTKMQPDLYSLFNILASYKGSLIDTLDRIDDRLLQATTSSTTTPLSNAKKYEISNVIINAIRTYQKMMLNAEKLLELILNQSLDSLTAAAKVNSEVQTDAYGSVDVVVQTDEGPNMYREIEAEVDVCYNATTVEKLKHDSDICLEQTDLPKIQGVKDEAPHNWKITSKTDETKKFDWREKTLMLVTNQKARNNFKWVRENNASEKKKIYDIMEDEEFNNEMCTFSHIQTPSEFYIHIGGPALCQELENAINDDLNRLYQYVVNKYKTKMEAKTHLGNFCFAFILAKSKWFRVEVLDWMFEESQRIFVQLIDHGNKIFCNYINLKAMNEFYAKIPRLGVRCHLALVYSTDLNDPMKWNEDSIDCLAELAKIKKFRISYLNKEGNSYGVDLWPEGSKDGRSVGEIMVSKGLALLVKMTQDDTLEKISENLVNWENLNKAAAGCETEPTCKFEHDIKDPVAMAKKTIVEFVLPEPDEYVTILVTGYIDIGHFYAQIITNPSNSSPNYNKEYQKLRDAMNASVAIKTYEKFEMCPALSELVLVKEDFEWRRGKCVSVECENIHIFLIDFGVIVVKKIEVLRRMKDDFLCVPQQAIECVLNQCQGKPSSPREQSIQFFQDVMHMRQFTAVVTDSGLPLRLQIWDKNGVDMDSVLKSFATRQDRCSAEGCG